MKAAIFHDQGGVDVLRYEDVSDPTPDPNEVVVRLHASALNRLDLKAREGRPEVAPMPHIGGLDGAGEIAELGANVKGWRVGDRVVIVPILSCGACDLCISGDNALCDQQKVFGFQTNGSFAEYVAVPSYNLVRVPTGVDLQSLAAIPCAYLTAWRMVVGKAKVREGETVLIHSVGSGVGSAALQIAKYLGARAIGTASLDTKLDGAKRMGADVVVNYRDADTLEAVRQFTEGKGVHVVIETVGADTWEISCRAARKNGRIVTCGVTSGSIAEMNIRYMYQFQLTIYGSVMGGKSELAQIVDLVEMGRLNPVIDRVLPLSRIREAHRALESREQFGKIVLDNFA